MKQLSRLTSKINLPNSKALFLSLAKPLLMGVVLTAAFIFLSEYAFAQSINIDIGEDTGGSATRRILQIVALLTILSIAPSILIMVTSFVRIVIVLSLLRSALGVQQTPPNQVLISLALFLTMFIMAPVMEKSYNEGILPLIEEKINEKEALPKIVAPFHTFMMTHVLEKDLALFVDMAGDLKIEKPEDTPFRVLIPAFMISELKRAFEIGFLIFVPFLIIDMVVAAVLMSMGMMMLPPVLISLPFKLIFFVLIDGWNMISSSLVKSFGM